MAGPAASGRRRRGSLLSQSVRTQQPLRVLAVTASMGAGHDGAAREIAARLEARGHQAVVKDLLDAAPFRIGRAVRSGYEIQLRHFPASYEATYGIWSRAPRLCRVVERLATALTGRRLQRWVRETEADLVVSTYPLATLALGRMRSAGRMDADLVGFVTDFAVHPLWVHPGADLILTVDASSARSARDKTGGPVVGCGPAVADRFDADRLPSRRDTRERLGLTDNESAVLIVAGSWGTGDVMTTTSAVSGCGFVPVVVCGRDAAIHSRVADQARSLQGRSIVLGWTDEMPALMSACDALVENAGGLTAFEAMRAGLPVITYQPIAGHGRANAKAMSAAGVTTWPKNEAELASSLFALTGGGPALSSQLARAASIFRQDPADLIAPASGSGWSDDPSLAEPA